MKQNMTKAQFLTTFPMLSETYLKGLIKVHGGWAKMKKAVVANGGINLAHFDDLDNDKFMQLFGSCVKDMKSYIDDMDRESLTSIRNQNTFRQQLDVRGQLSRMGYHQWSNVHHAIGHINDCNTDVAQKIIVAVTTYVTKNVGIKLNGG